MKYNQFKNEFHSGCISIYNGDCMDLLRQTPNKYYDLCIVDPPYGLGSKLVQGGTWSKKWQKKGAEWDFIPDDLYFKELFRVCKNWIIWGGNYYLEYLPNCRNFISWHKPYMDGMHSMSNVELAFTSFDMNAKSIDFNKDVGVERIHVCQKPVALYKWLLKNYAKEGQTILDTHLGSGSSAIAAHDGGFEFTGIELDEEYYNAAKDRIIMHQRQLNLF